MFAKASRRAIIRPGCRLNPVWEMRKEKEEGKKGTAMRGDPALSGPCNIIKGGLEGGVREEK